MNAALLFHFVLIAVFIFIKSFLEFFFLSPLIIPQSIFINQTLNFTGSKGIVCVSSISSVVFLAILTFFFQLHYFFLIDFFLIDMLFVLLRLASGWRVGTIDKNRRWKTDCFFRFSIIKMMSAERLLVFGKGIVVHFILNCGCWEGRSCFSDGWFSVAVVFSRRLKREAFAVVIPSKGLPDISCRKFAFVGDRSFIGGFVVASTVMVALMFDHVIEFLQVGFDAINFGDQNLRVFLIFFSLRVDGLKAESNELFDGVRMLVFRDVGEES